MWEIAVLVEGLERKGVLTRQEIYDAITELRRKQGTCCVPHHPRNSCTPTDGSPPYWALRHPSLYWPRPFDMNWLAKLSNHETRANLPR